MRLLQLRLRDFRNISHADLAPGERATLVYGPNGHGKTNLLEAIYLLVTLRPLRASRYAELPRFGEELGEVEGVVEVGPVQRTISVTVEGSTRIAKLDGKKTRDLDAYFGGIAVVAFTPDDLSVIKGGPELRRRHLDRSVFNRFPSFLSESRTYRAALQSTNKLLREGAPSEVLEAFHEPLAKAATAVVLRRRAFLQEFGERFSQTLSRLSKGQLEGEVTIRSRGIGPGLDADTLASEYMEALKERLPIDRQRGFTSLGPHTDKIEFILDGRPARLYASQGQQRAMILAWKISEIENLRDHLGFQPLLLLDDVSSELDPERNRQLLTYLTAFDGQVILTTTDPGFLLPAAGPSAAYFSVRNGAFTEVAFEDVPRSPVGGQKHE